MFLISLKCDMCKKKVAAPDYESPAGWFSVKETGKGKAEKNHPFFDGDEHRKHYCSRDC
jgi:hypothetical protein